MRSTWSTHSNNNTSLQSNQKDELKQIAQLEKEWLERQMYSQDNRGYYA